MPSELDVYQPPKVDVPASVSTDRGKVYTARQIGIATFTGSPVAGCLLLASNYGRLGRPAARIQAIVWGFVSTVVLFAVASFLPKNVPNWLLPIAYSGALEAFAKTTEGSDFQARRAAAGTESTWKAVGIGLACMAVILGLLVLYFMLVGNRS